MGTIACGRDAGSARDAEKVRAAVDCTGDTDTGDDPRGAALFAGAADPPPA
jgi:hypothetical protein